MNTQYNAAKVMAGIVSSSIKTANSTNPNQIFLEGQILLSKEEFNHLNKGPEDYVHGYSVLYGPFDTESAAEDFVTRYPKDLWPQPEDWIVRHTGEMLILSPYRPDTHKTVVDNLSNEFQPHLTRKQQQKKAQEIQEIKDKKAKAESNPSKLKPEELDMVIMQHKEKIQRAERDMEGYQDYLKLLQKLRTQQE